MDNNGLLYVITGPTASGKTAIGIELAKLVGGEIISADSMQVYKDMNIGTAKPTEEEMDGVSHHLISIITPSTPFSVAEYQQLAKKAIADVFARGKVPILVGGTGFYINAVLYGTEFTPTEDSVENKLREDFVKIAEEKGTECLHDMLKNIDPVSAENIHKNNIKRVARALSYCKVTNSLFSDHNKNQKELRKTKANLNYNSVFITLNMPREVLYNRINKRTHIMWDTGLVNETKNLLALGYNQSLPSMNAIGYKETLQYLNGLLTESDTIESIKQATRNYAKRQETWFRHQSPEAIKLNVHEKTAKEIVKEII